MWTQKYVIRRLYQLGMEPCEIDKMLKFDAGIAYGSLTHTRGGYTSLDRDLSPAGRAKASVIVAVVREFDRVMDELTVEAPAPAPAPKPSPERGGSRPRNPLLIPKGMVLVKRPANFGEKRTGQYHYRGSQPTESTEPTEPTGNAKGLYS